MTVRLSEPDPDPGTNELPQIKSAIRQVTTAHFRLILTMQKLCLRAERREASGTALDNAQVGTARTLGGRGLQALDLLLEDLINALVTTVSIMPAAIASARSMLSREIRAVSSGNTAL